MQILYSELGDDKHRKQMEHLLSSRSCALHNQTGKLLSTTASLRKMWDKVGSCGQLASLKLKLVSSSLSAQDLEQNGGLVAVSCIVALLDSSAWSKLKRERTPQMQLELRLFTFLVHIIAWASAPSHACHFPVESVERKKNEEQRSRWWRNAS